MSNSNKMSVTQLTVLTAVNMMGSGIIMLPSKLAKVGTMSILSWIVTALGSLALAYAFAMCGRFSKRPGGMSGYTSYAFGKSGAFMCSFTYSISLVIANVAIAITCVGYLQEFLEVVFSPIEITACAIAIVWITTFANFGGAKITGAIGGITVWGVIIPVVTLSVVGWFWFDVDMYIAAWNPHNLPFVEGVSASIAMTLWAFLGLESACANSSAVENPEKNVPIAVLGGTLGAAVVYILSTNVCAGIVENSALAESTAPFALVWSQLLGGWAGKAVAFLSVVACAGSLLGWQFTVAQSFKDSADEKMFPALFSAVSERGAPIKGMIVLAVVQTLMSLMTISPDLNSQFEAIVNLAVVTNLIPYILCMAAIFIIQDVAKVPAAQAKRTNTLAFLGAIYSFYALYGSGYEAMMWGGIVTFFGWTAYGFIAKHHEQVVYE